MTIKKAIITGSNGLVGKSLTKLLTNVWPLSRKWDLSSQEDTRSIFSTVMSDPALDYEIYHLAAKVGGVGANQNYLGDFFTQNILINTNVLEIAKKLKVKKLLSLASTCVYPKDAEQPLKEKDLHNGWPHETNYAYAFAKRMLHVQSMAYREQYGCNFVVAVPTNVFGPEDNFHLENAHAIPAIIHKIYLAKKNNQDSVELWGDGRQERDFIYVDDLSRALILVMEKYNDKEPINIATGKDVSIDYIVGIIVKSLKYTGKIKWSEQNKGIEKKSVDITKISKIGWEPKISIETGLEVTCNWFMTYYPKVRGAK